jgi:hypothetical protein
MSVHNETQPSSSEDRIHELEEVLKKTRTDLTKMSSLLANTYDFAYSTAQENTQLKKRIEELEAEATRSGARTQEHLHQHPSSPMSPVSVPTSPRVHHPQYQCSLAMATCDGLYPPSRYTNTPRLSPETPEPEHDERIITRDGKRYRLWTQYGINGHCWTCEDEIPDNQDQDQDQDQSKSEDEYEKDPATYWQKAYPKWECKYHEEMSKLEAQEAQEANDY